VQVAAGLGDEMKKIVNFGLMVILVLGISTSCKKTDTKKDEPVQRRSAINFVAKNIKGVDFSLDSFKGKAIMLAFSAYWCGPCRAEAKELNDLYKKYKNQGFEIVQVLIEDESGKTADLSDIKRWAAEFGIEYTLLYDEDQSSSNDYSVVSLPTNIFIDKDFKIQNIILGFSSIASFESTIKSML
jgi:peroxiredoxin